MEKVREYEFEGIEICRNCKGTGAVDSEGNWLHKAVPEECPVCNGSGRIVKNKHIVIKINPFEG
jgi:DnaJ-class molecular chaperone